MFASLFLFQGTDYQSKWASKNEKCGGYSETKTNDTQQRSGGRSHKYVSTILYGVVSSYVFISDKVTDICGLFFSLTSCNAYVTTCQLHIFKPTEDQDRSCSSSSEGKSHQWCVSLTPDNTKTMGRMTCHCFQ